MKKAPSRLVFLKLGGSLITDKTTPQTARYDVISRLAREIAEAKNNDPDLQLVLGHGSGSFGHVPAKKYGTRQGVRSSEEWLGFVEVWYQASALHRIVIEAMHAAKLPAISFPASGAVTASGGSVINWNVSPLKAALGAGLIPVVYGDVVFDKELRGTILSTEDIFVHLAYELHPSRILLAGIDEGVWADYPHCTKLISEISPDNWEMVSSVLSGSQATDVTGGMASKVQEMYRLIQDMPNVKVFIFSGRETGNVTIALADQSSGTRITGS